MQDLHVVSRLLDGHLNLKEEKWMMSRQQHHDLEELKKNLARIIEHLLSHDIERLLQAMYRVDVDEQKFQVVFEQGSSDELAELIIQRELEKVKWRQQYREL